MPGASASPLLIPYMLPTDDLASLDEFTLSLANRLHTIISQRQGGTATITPSAANTDTTLRINFAYPYTDTPRVVVSFRESLVPGSSVIWATAPDADGFTLGIRSTNVTPRSITWIACPSS